MKLVLFYHSLISDWNHGNAHFLRGVVCELLARGHTVEVYEPVDAWSVRHLLQERGPQALQEFSSAYPQLHSHRFDAQRLDLDEVLADADVVIVHEWNDVEWVARIGSYAARNGCKALFHDTHHRSVSDPQSIAALDLRHYDGVLAFGATVADCYRRKDWAEHVWIWHEAADTRRFHPLPCESRNGDLVWIGNWGDDERNAELREFLIDPIAQLGLKATFHGVRYPEHALSALQAAHIEYGGWLPNHRVPTTFAQYGCTVHVPRRAYTQMLRGVPTIRVFEALACGIPLICAPWHDDEQLFRPGIDYLIARDGEQMRAQLHLVLHDRDLARRLSEHGRQSILERHTCAHRVDELLEILASLNAKTRRNERASASFMQGV